MYLKFINNSNKDISRDTYNLVIDNNNNQQLFIYSNK